MVNMMIKTRLASALALALRTFKYERTDTGLYFTKQRIGLGGVFSHQLDDGPWHADHNAYALEALDKMLSDWFNNGSNPAAFYIAPFTNVVTPASSLKAADFASTLGELTGYVEGARQTWTPNGNSVAQTMSNSNAVAVFTGGASAATIRGAGLLTSGVKGGAGGVLVAASRFATDNQLNPGSTFKIKYDLVATPVAG